MSPIVQFIIAVVAIIVVSLVIIYFKQSKKKDTPQQPIEPKKHNLNAEKLKQYKEFLEKEDKSPYYGMTHISDSSTEEDDGSDWEKYYKERGTKNTSSLDNNQGITASTSIRLNKPVNINFTHASIEDFIDARSKSINQKWEIVWSDIGIADKILTGGYRTQGKGFFGIQSNEDKRCKLCENKLERPNQGRIANNGNGLIVDYLFGDDLSCVVYVFSCNIVVLFEKEFSANYLNGDISECGNFIIFQLARSKTEDSNKLNLINITDNEIVFSIKTEKRAESYVIDIDKKIVKVKFTKDRKQYRYNFNGEFLDSDKLTNSILSQSTNYHEVIDLTTKLLKNDNLDKEIVADILDSLNRLGNTVEQTHQHCFPKIYRNKGICYEMLGDNKHAIIFYQKALELDPKIGIKKRLDKLSKAR